ncbi:MAG: SIS domain-containing protein, partial [Acidimicrobiaceae bacterium]|nr:SIS domain-containing protein [Acidimicrobiaceae bacterium]
WDNLWAIQVALAAIDRLEVRGRDSAGLGLLVCGHGLDVTSPEVTERTGDPLFTSRSVRVSDGCLSFVYKAAAEIGELGDNTAALRAAIRSDHLLGKALSAPGATCTVLGHTRWASVGLISEANAHPLNSEEAGRVDAPYVTAVLNGDVDNHADLRLSEALRLPPEVTTDAKVIPTLVSRRLSEGYDLDAAVRATVTRFDGSVAIGVSSAVQPDQLHLALKGSGQSLYIGLAEDAFVVASEPYGVVEETDRFLRMDGEVTQGQTARLDRAAAGTLEGVALARYDGAPIALEPRDVRHAEITTRDIDRRGFPHFLLKEISEAPRSFQKTLRGRVVTEADGRSSVHLGDDVLGPQLREALASGTVRRVLIVGQGTAAVAGQAVAAAIGRLLPQCSVQAMPATELSGFGLTDEMGDTLVVAVSQSGTTTDTNRTVDLVRARGAHTIGIVNRRNSDLVAKVAGVLYTSDGRDVEMSVASTKAFYAQVAAGWLLAVALAEATGQTDDETIDRLVGALRGLPAAMAAVVDQREAIGRVAARVAPSRRYWAVVGSGPDRVAAEEIRIKLSELCYKSIACDATEDKKHIDLSSEPLILVCAAGLSGPNAADVAKEIAIYRAHKASPVVIAARGEASRFHEALDVIEVPAVEPEMAFVLSAMAGHVFGYEAALSIDGQSRPLREARAAIEAEAVKGRGRIKLDRLAPILARVTQPFLDGVREGSYNGHLEAATAIRMVSLLRYATGTLPVEAYEFESGKIGAPSTLVTDLLEALGAAIDELTRPVDAIKHQAKTVTVGISRSEDALLGVRLVA